MRKIRKCNLKNIQKINKIERNTSLLYRTVKKVWYHRDNGNGISEIIRKNKLYGFGLTLIDGLTKQYFGSFEIIPDNDTLIKVTLKC